MFPVEGIAATGICSDVSNISAGGASELSAELAIEISGFGLNIPLDAADENAAKSLS
ncbi:hypothetical protein ROBYS_23930 [Roseobacter sp. OBYS 0001]|nr:hypothetical protein ROBYS_23930 [Roseobacter sp. OBYS 0001]